MNVITLNKFTAGNQSRPWISALPRGKFAVAWQDTDQNGNNTIGIYGNVMNSTGSVYDQDLKISESDSGSAVTVSGYYLSAPDQFVALWKDSNEQ